MTTDKMATLARTSKIRSKKGRFTSRKPRQKKVPVDANNNDICEDEIADPGPPLKWNEGRRIIELGEVVNSLLSGCVKYGTVLNLTNTVSETMRGLGSILYLRCNEVGCDGMTGILTAKRHRSDVKGSQSVFDGNTNCWLSTETGLIWAFVGPAAFVILINFIVIVSIFRKMAQTTMLKGKSAKQKITTSVRSLCVLLPLLGCCWVFGVLSINSDLVVFQYLFCVVNSLQGVFVFVFHCMYNQQLRDALRRRKERKHSQSTLKSSFKSKSRNNSSGDNGDHYQARKIKRKPSESHNSTSSDYYSGRDPTERWITGPGKQHQRDLRHKLSE